jgi:AraC-like DNA-binding protein
VSDSNVAAVPPVDQKHIIDVGAGSPHLVVWIARMRLEEHLRTMLERPVIDPIRFSLGMDLRAWGVRSWRRVVDLLLEEVDGGGPIPDQPLAMRELERLLLTQLLLAQPNNYSALLHQQPRATAPRVIRQAAELIDAHAAEPLTVEDIAEATGLSVRALQEGFRRFLDTTPMNHLREARLRHVREELIAADPTSATVTDIAVRWGFRHTGRFSVHYRERFGESPSATLRR